MAPAGALLVEILSGHASPWAGELAKDEILIGRGAECDVRLHPTKDTLCASRVHLRLVRRGPRVEVVCEHVNGVTVEPDGDPARFLEQGERASVSGNFQIVIGHNGPLLGVHPVGEELPGTLKGKAAGRRGSMQPLGRISGELVHAARSGRRLALIGLAGLALALAVGGWWAWTSAGKLEAVRRQREAEVDRLIREQDTLRRAVSKRPATESLRAALLAARESVVLVGVQRNDGAFEPIGTAWTAAPGTLVTNAHVARALDSGRRDGGRAIGRRGPGLEATVEIASIETHPAFDAWIDVMSQQAIRAGAGEAAANLIPIGDVALLRVAGGETGPPLELAPDDEPASVGDPVGYDGFPMEGAAGLPTLQVFTGTVTAVTDPFFGRASGTEGLLVHHNVMAAGGASGSPILDERGKVVAVLSAGSMVAVGQDAGTQRVPIGLNYGQSAVLVRELLEGRAAQAQSSRDGVWRERIAKVFVSPEERLAMKAADLERDLKTRSELVRNDSLRLGEVSEGVRMTVPLEPGYHYVFLAAAKDWSDLTLAIGQNGAADEWNRSERAVVTTVLKKTDAARTVDVVLKAPHAAAAGTQVQLRVLRFKG